MVKLQSLAIKSAAAEGRAPRRVKLFINRASLGFNEAADFAPVQVRRGACLLPFSSAPPARHAAALTPRPESARVSASQLVGKQYRLH